MAAEAARGSLEEMGARKAVVVAWVAGLGGLAIDATACGSSGAPAGPVAASDAGVVVTRDDGGARDDDAGAGAGGAGDAEAGIVACASPAWARAYGEGAVAEVVSLSGVATDASGAVFVAGLFTSDVDFGTGVLHAARLGSSFVAKLDSAGRAAWARSFEGSGETQALGVGVAPDGSRVVVTGTFTGTLANDGDDGGADAAAPDQDVFVLALDGASGATAWSKHLGGPGLDRGLGVAVAADGSIALSGAFARSIDFGDGAHATTATNGAAYLALVSASGATSWSRAYDGLVVGANALARDASGAVLFTGFGASIDLGAGTIATGGDKDVVVAKIDLAGNHVYSASFGGAGDQYGYGAAVAPDGSLVFSGGFQGALAFDGDAGDALVPKGAGPDVFVASVDPAGHVKWGVRGGSDAFGVSVAVAADGHVLVLEDEPPNAGPAPRSSARLRALGPDGQGARVPFALVGQLDSLGEAVAALPAGGAVLGGTFSGDLSFCDGAGLAANAAEARTYLVALDAAGVRAGVPIDAGR